MGRKEGEEKEGEGRETISLASGGWHAVDLGWYLQPGSCFEAIFSKCYFSDQF